MISSFFVPPRLRRTLALGLGLGLTLAGIVPAQESRLVNLSTRASAGTGANVLTAGFVIGPGGDKQVLIRAAGPALTAFGLTGVLADPILTLYNSSNVVVATNDNWAAANASIMTNAGAFAFASGSADAAIVTTLAPGSYTAQVTGANNTTGLSLVEVYELTATGSRLVNISTRAQVGTGASVVIPGLALTGTGARKLLVRAVGPGLASFGVTGVLADPTLSLTNQTGTTTFATNDNWGTAVSGGTAAATLSAAFTAAGAFPLTAGSADAAVLTNLSPGNYTIQVSGVNNTSGVALVEVYDVTGATISTETGTGASAEAAAAASAAQAFLATLSTTQQATVALPFTLTAARRWSNLPASSNFVARNGISWGALTTAQRAAATAMLSSVLSSAGQTLREGLQAADDYLAANGGGTSYGAGLYYIAMYGTPSATGFWVLQFTGHHLTFNFTFNGNYKSGTPFFLGVEPRTTFTINGATYDPMIAQRTAAGDLFAALPSYSGAQLSGTFTDIVFGANGAGNIDGTYPKAYPTAATGRGVLYTSLSAADQEKVKAVVRSYVNTQAAEYANDLLGVYFSETALAQTYVAYAGPASLTTSNSYLRVDGPRLWIEFSVQGGVIIRNEPHYHTIWRDKAADYGGNF